MKDSWEGFFFLVIYSFIFSCAGSSLLCRLFSSYGERGLLSSRSAQASHCMVSLFAEHKLKGVGTSVVVVHGLGSCGSQLTSSIVVTHGLSCSLSCEIFPG